MTVGRRRLLTTGVTALGLGVLNPRRSWAADAEVATTLGRLRGADQGDYRSRKLTRILLISALRSVTRIFVIPRRLRRNRP